MPVQSAVRCQLDLYGRYTGRCCWTNPGCMQGAKVVLQLDAGVQHCGSNALRSRHLTSTLRADTKAGAHAAADYEQAGGAI